MGKIRPLIKWADVEAVKAELHSQLDAILGGVTEEDLHEPDKKKKKKVCEKCPIPNRFLKHLQTPSGCMGDCKRQLCIFG